MTHIISFLRTYLYLIYITTSLIIGLAAPKLFALLLPVSACITLAFCRIETIKESFFTRTMLFLNIFILYMLLTIPFSMNPEHSLVDALQFAIICLCFFLLLSLKPELDQTLDLSHQKFLYWLFVLLVIILLVLNLAVLLEWLPLRGHTFNRAGVVYALVFWPLLMVMGDLKDLRYPAGLGALLFVAILLGNSETALLMFLAGNVGYFIFQYFTPAKKTGAFLTLFMLCVMIFTPLLLGHLNNMGFTGGFEFLFEKKLHQLQIWSESLKEIIENMPGGTGINVSRFFSNVPERVSHGFPIHHPHNMTLEILLNFGLVGIICLVFLLFMLVKLYSLTPKTLDPYVVAMIFSLVLLYSLNYSIWQEWRTGLVAFSLVVTVTHFRNIAKTEQP